VKEMLYKFRIPIEFYLDIDLPKEEVIKFMNEFKMYNYDYGNGVELESLKRSLIVLSETAWEYYLKLKGVKFERVKGVKFKRVEEIDFRWKENGIVGALTDKR